MAVCYVNTSGDCCNDQSIIYKVCSSSKEHVQWLWLLITKMMLFDKLFSYKINDVTVQQVTKFIIAHTVMSGPSTKP